MSDLEHVMGEWAWEEGVKAAERVNQQDSEPMILDCQGHAGPVAIHFETCWREATPQERLAGLTPGDGNLEAFSVELAENGIQLDELGVKASLTAWLGGSDG